MIEINHVFGIGFRCNVPEFLKHYDLRNTASPFDWMFIDFDTAVALLKTGFCRFLKDQVEMHHATRALTVLRPDVPSFIPSTMAHRLPSKFSDLLHAPLRYFSQDYTDVKLMLSIPYCFNEDGRKLSQNIYEWSRICVFNQHHHDFSNPDTLICLQRRVDRMQTVLRENEEHTLLFHITRIESRFSTLEEAARHYRHVYEGIRAYAAILVCSDRIPDSHVMTGRLLVIVKYVPAYAEQIRVCATDNELRNCDSFKKEYAILRSHFAFVLHEEP